MSDPDNSANQPTPSTEKKEFSMETRLIIAFVLMGAVLFLTPYIFKPQEPLPAAKAPAKTAAQAPAATPPSTTAPSVAPAAAAPKGKARRAAAAPQVVADKEETFVVDTAMYRIQFSNRGATVHSWVLKKFKDSAGKPLELVNTSAVEKTGYPFSIVPKNARVSADPNQVLYKATRSNDGQSIEFTFSDGKLAVKKSFHFDQQRYLSEVRSEVVQDGAPVSHLLAWRGGFGDHAVPNPATTQRSLYFDLARNKLVVNEAKVGQGRPARRDRHVLVRRRRGRFLRRGFPSRARFLPGNRHVRRFPAFGGRPQERGTPLRRGRGRRAVEPAFALRGPQGCRHSEEGGPEARTDGGFRVVRVPRQAAVSLTELDAAITW